MSETTRVKTITEVTQKQNEDSSKLREELASLKRSNLEKDSALERLTGELNDVTREYVPPNETNA
jgi:predicted RNase H-like nuclease (RuvC/YqgF family)